MATIIRFRVLVAILGAGLTVVAAFGLSRQTFDDSFRKIFHADSQEFNDYEALLDKFGNDENSCQLLLEGDNLFTAEGLRAVRSLHGELNNCEGVSRVISIGSLRKKRRVGRYFSPLLGANFDSDDTALQNTIETLFSHPLADGYLISDQRDATLMIVQLEGGDLTVPDIDRRLATIHEVARRFTRAVPLQYSITGQPCLRVEVVESTQRDQIVFTFVAILLVIIVAWWLFGNLVALLIVSVAPIIGVIWTVGMMGLLGESLNVLNVVIPNMFLVIGFSDSVHLLFDARREMSSGATTPMAARAALTRVGPACVLTSVTTAIGFGSLVMAEDDIIQRFGVTCAIGTLLTMLAVLTIVPILISTPLGRHCGNQGVSFLSPAGTNWLANLIEGVLIRRRPIVVVGVFVTGLLLASSFWLTPDFRYTENLPESSPALQAYRETDRQFSGAGLVHIVVRLPQDDRLTSSQLGQLLEDVHAIIDASKTVSHPVSILTLLQSLPGDDVALMSKTRELKYLPSEVRNQFSDQSDHEYLVTGRVRDEGSARLQPAFDKIRAELVGVQEHFPGVKFTLSGIPVISTYRSQKMIRDLAKSLGLAAILIFGIIALAMRSWKLGLISVIPNMLPLAALAATMVVAGLPLRYSGVLCFCVCLGLVVDDSIHFLARYQHERGAGCSPEEGAHRAFVVMAPVLVTTTLLMLIGFGVTALSGVPTIRQFGLLGCAALIWAVLADLILLPAMLAGSVAYPLADTRSKTHP